MAVQFRSPTIAEVPGIQTVWRASFGRDIDRMQADWTAEHDPLSRALIATDKGEVLAVVCIMSRTVRDASARQQLVGGIGAVATHPDVRGRGYAGRLLEQAIELMTTRCYRWSLLFTGTPQVYARRGWRPLPLPGREGELATQATERSGRYRVRCPGRPADWSVLADVYAAFNENRPLTAIRRPREWNCGVGGRLAGGRLFVAESGSKIIGYASAVHNRGTVELREIAANPEHTAAIDELARAVARWAKSRHCERVLAAVPSDIPLDSLLVHSRPAHPGYAMAHPLDNAWSDIERAAEDPSARFWLADAF